MGRKPRFEEVRAAMGEGFADAFGVELVEGELTNEELELAGLLKSKYASEEWLKKR